MRILGVFLVVLVLAPAGWAADLKCKECGVRFPREARVSFGMISFCSESCKDAFAEKDRNLGECKGCGVEILGDRREFVSGDTRYIKIGQRPRGDGYCNACRADLKTGNELGTNRAIIEERAAAAEWDDEEPAPQPVRKKKRKLDAESESGFGAMTYVLVIVGAVGLLIRFFLKS